MIFLIVTIPIFTYISMIVFAKLNLTVKNYKLKWVPYNLGIIVLYSYVLLSLFSSQNMGVFSPAAFFYIFDVWFLGFIDDLVGKSFPKGLKGHFYYGMKKKILTTGLLKALGTGLLSLMYLFLLNNVPLPINVLFFFLLIGFPHVMNLFDTRPLRV